MPLRIQPQSSQLAKPLLSDPGMKSGISVRELTSTSKTTTTADEERMVEQSPKILASKRRRGTNGRPVSENPRDKAQTGNEWSNSLRKSSKARIKLQPRVWVGFKQVDPS